MALYPSLEDMVVDQYQNAQGLTSAQPNPAQNFYQQEPLNPNYGALNAPPPIYESIGEAGKAYPSLSQDYRNIQMYPGARTTREKLNSECDGEFNFHNATSTTLRRRLPWPPARTPSLSRTTRPSAVIMIRSMNKLYRRRKSIEEPFCELGEAIAVEEFVEDSEDSENELQPFEVIQNGRLMVAPITSQSPGLALANVSHGVRQVVLCKDEKGKVGMRFRSVNKGIFVQFVAENSPAALAGMRFGDQILQINKAEVVGLSQDKAMDLLTKSKNNASIELAVRDRPFERTITLHKDSRGQLGFGYNDNEIVSIVKDSSASRNGLLINHRILEVDGQNVIGLKTKALRDILEDAPKTVTLTIMPNELYNEMMKKISWSLLRKQDHSIPDF
ncbi:hypothetical protein L596_027781 [Steinernema carpocapsae]|uniref:PDZ domain-containing protein n=1 Tax=Steinernema carpocapsae TaxID=34508 RepID=A0A4U5LWJ5_STECR|nr:hypothetical protein L596_027781 [Steinernema carpocapsae]